MKKLKFVLLALVAVQLTGCVEVVDTGTTGVKKRFGEIQKQAYEPGMYFYNPFTTSMFAVDNKEQRLESKTMVYTKDVQQATIEYVLNYYLEPNATIDIVGTVGRDYERKLIPQAVNGSIKNIIGKWDAIELIGSRETATDQIKEAIGKELSRKGLSITTFQLTDISYQNAFENAVEAKVIAVQKAEEAKNNTKRIEEEATQKVMTAEADAEAMQIKTNALAKSQSLVLYEAVQKWDGTLPRIMSDGGMLLQLKDE